MKDSNQATLIKGVLAALTAAVGFGFIPVISKTLVVSTMDSKSVIAGQCILGAVFLFLFLKARKVSLRLTLPQAGGMAIIWIADSFTMYLLYESYHYIDIGIAMLAHFLYPVVVVIIMTAVFRERLTLLRFLALLFAIGGMFIMSGIRGGNILGLAMATGSGVAYGIYNVANQKSPTRDLSPLVVTFYDLILLSVTFFVISLATDTLTVPASGSEWGMLFVNGLLKVGGASLTIYAMQKIGSVRTSIISMVELVTSIIGGVIVFHEVLSERQILGGCGILLGAILVVFGDKRKRGGS